MFHQLSKRTCFLKLFLVISAVMVVLAEPMETVPQAGQSQPFILIERIKPASERALQAQANTNGSGLYVMWQKLLVRVTSQWQQPVLSKSFDLMKVPTGEEMTPYSIEQIKFRNVVAEVKIIEMEKRIIQAVLTLMQILLVLDIVILGVVFIMLLSCFCKSKKPTEEEVVKA